MPSTIEVTSGSTLNTGDYINVGTTLTSSGNPNVTLRFFDTGDLVLQHRNVGKWSPFNAHQFYLKFNGELVLTKNNIQPANPL